MSEEARIYRVELHNGEYHVLSAPAKITEKSIKPIKGGKEEFYDIAQKMMLPKFELGKSVFASAQDAIEAEAARLAEEAEEHRMLAAQADERLATLEAMELEDRETAVAQEA